MKALNYLLSIKDSIPKGHTYDAELDEAIAELKTLDQYYEKGLDEWQMQQIRLRYEHGLSDQQVKKYAKADLRWNEMEQIRKELEKEYFSQ